MFTVSKSQERAVKRYIQTQHEHHRREDFKAELLRMLLAHGIEFMCFAASDATDSSLLNKRTPSLSSSMGFPSIEPDVSRTRTQGTRGSGFSPN